LIFRKFGIPVYLIWDADAGKGEITGRCGECNKPLEGKQDPEDNRRLLRILGVTEKDWPDQITPSFCVFKVDLETTLRDEVGPDVFDQLLVKAQADFAIPKRKHALKNPKVIAAIIAGAKAQGCESATLNAIVDHVMAMAKPTPSAPAEVPKSAAVPEPELVLTQ
jgi:hypothetical protein